VRTTLEQRLRPELDPGERLLWSGGPHLSWLVRADRTNVPFSLVSLAFGVLWEHAALTDKNPNGSERYGTFFHVWGLLFIIFGVYALIGRIPVRRLLAGRTAYGITDRRALVVRASLLGYRRVASTPLRRASPVTVRPSGRGRGSVFVGPLPARMLRVAGGLGEPQDRWERRLPGTVVFWNVSRADAVAAVATDAVAAAEE
jgi:hypothetical protein